jgi:hypothetical protein
LSADIISRHAQVSDIVTLMPACNRTCWVSALASQTIKTVTPFGTRDRLALVCTAMTLVSLVAYLWVFCSVPVNHVPTVVQSNPRASMIAKSIGLNLDVKGDVFISR